MLFKLVLFSLTIYVEQSFCANETHNKQDYIYAVVIDAGSTGSRVFGYEFQKQADGFFKLLREEFHSQKPGLSSYAGNPDEGAQRIMDLIEEVDSFVPDHLKPETLLYLRATAGLRLLGEDIAQKLLQAVQEKFKRTKYRVEPDAAGLLSGADEGIFAWFSVNYFKGALDSKPFATLEMGGGSAQVTYIPQARYFEYFRNCIYPSPYKNLKVFSKSFLGLGLNAARDTLFQVDSRREISEGQRVFSECFHPSISDVEFEFNNKKYFISGKPGSTRNRKTNIYTCKYYVIKYLIPKVIPKPVGLSEENSIAVSAFYYRGLAAELIVGPSGKIRLGQLWEKAKTECTTANNKDPFLCMDMVYMYTLLKNGYGLTDDNIVEMILTIDDHKLSWTLGLAFSQLTKIIL